VADRPFPRNGSAPRVVLVKRVAEPNGHEPTLSDEQIVRRYRSGDAGAASVLLDRYFPLLRARVRRRLSGKVRRRVAESDVIQDAYLAALNCIDEFEDRGEGSLRAWLIGIADHRLHDAVRRHTGTAKRSTQREVTRAGRPETAYLVAVQRTPSKVAATDEQVARIRSAMVELSADHRRVLQLALEEGLSLREVAVHMGRSREAAKKLYGRAVCRLRSLVETEDAA
jgi:RNA polymerase sigma-70 factor (ECF subfamily)